ncbi:MAG: SPOR domain-containing protein [Burkholderiales bacterium]|nr:SPOR domain-containing protein [Burkholderiales bacterium]
MKALIAILIVANLAFLGWGYLSERQPSRDAELLRSQLNPDKVRILPGEPEVAAPAPEPAVEACLEWGPFAPDELARARNALASLQAGDRLASVATPVSAGWWVYIPPHKDRASAERRVADLKTIGISDSYLVQERGEWENAISLGIFRNEDGAQRFLESLQNRGVRAVRMGARQQQVKLASLYLRNPLDVEAQRLTALRTEFPATAVKAGKCP